MAANWSNDWFEFHGTCLPVQLLRLYIRHIFCKHILEEEIDPAADRPVFIGLDGMHFWLPLSWILHLWDFLRSQHAFVVFTLLSTTFVFDNVYKT